MKHSMIGHEDTLKPIQPLLDIRGLNIIFKPGNETSTAVQRSYLSVNRGEMLAIVGESGSGKSATALSFLQLLPKQAVVDGQLLFWQEDGSMVDLLRLSVKDINAIRGNKIAMIFQEPMSSLNPVFTCGRQVMEAIRQHQKDISGKPVSTAMARQRTITLFEKVRLPDPAGIIDRYPHQLSGGQKQRVMIAMAISCGPSLLIADEPTTALDVTVQRTILELIKELQLQNNMGVIFITHDLAVVADIADKLAVMYKGHIVEQGDAATIMRTPIHPYTRALLACRPAIHPKGERLPIVSDLLNNDGSTKAAVYPSPAISSIPVAVHPSTILAVEGLKVHFPAKRTLLGKPTQFFKALDGVSFTVNKGETIGLVGESGCGKTTVARAILQLIQPTEGNIILNGKDISKLSPAQLRKIRKDLQIVFQDPYGSLNPRMTIGNAILEPLQVQQFLCNNKERKEKVIGLLEKVDLKPDHFDRYPHQFSGGQRQRICIARALALAPSFLIFDESVSALDVSVQAQVLNLLNDLKKEFGFSAIFISHDLSVVHYISDRILVMYKGRIIEEGPAGQVYHHPKERYTQKLIEAIPGRQLI